MLQVKLYRRHKIRYMAHPGASGTVQAMPKTEVAPECLPRDPRALGRVVIGDLHHENLNLIAATLYFRGCKIQLSINEQNNPSCVEDTLELL